MSNFYCEKCGAAICDSPKGYVTGCEHYPIELMTDYFDGQHSSSYNWEKKEETQK